MIKTIFFDIGRVIIDFDFDRSIDLLQKHTPLNFDTLKKVIKQNLFATGLFDDLNTGKVAYKTFYERVLAKTGVEGVSQELFEQYWNSHWLNYNIEMEELLVRVKPDTQLMLLSTMGEHSWKYLQNYYIFNKYFSDEAQQIFSHKVSCKKPDPQIYKIAIKASGSKPEECLFIDDSQKNLSPFEELGGLTILYNCREDSIADLEKTLVNNDVLM